MRKATLFMGIVAGVVVALLAMFGGGSHSASADGGPHAVEAGSTPDKCAGCHRIHTGKNEYLLKEAGTLEQFCYSCHGTAGNGSKLSVQNGTLYGDNGRTDPQTTVGLRAGGFDEARIETDDPSIWSDPTVTIGVISPPEAVTSKHLIDGTAGTMWGNGAIGSGAGPSATLDCVSCHDPHGNGQYRILRSVPTGSGAAAVAVPDQADPKTYAVSNYFDMSGPVSLVTISSWCATCHTRYLAASTAGSGDPIFSNRHVSNGSSDRACITCHASHGSNAAMSGTYSQNVPFPDGSAGDARMLKMDNRGICRKCHSQE